MTTTDPHLLRFHARHADQVAAGQHDETCEWEPGFYLCHCSKRRREAAGHTEVPTDDLDFPPPSCPRCYADLEHDGDGWDCTTCALSWDSDGSASSATFTDDYGSMDRCEKHGHRSCWNCELAAASAGGAA